MLQLLSALGTLGTVFLLLACLRLRRRRGAGLAPTGRFPRLERLLTWCVYLSFITLAMSGFWRGLWDRPLSGYLLLLHVGCGGVLAVAFTLALLFWAPRFAFAAETKAGFAYCSGHRLGFWLLAIALVGVMVTPFAAMLPWLGTDGQELLVAAHRLCALLALALALSLTAAEARLRQAPE